MPSHLAHTTETIEQHGGKAVALDARDSRERTPALASIMLTPDMDDFALCYCYEYHMAHPRSSRSPQVRDEKLLACMKAVGMASYYTATQSLTLRTAAMTYYATALSAVNVALMSLSSALQDTTLLAIMALSSFEMMTSTFSPSLKGWASHVRGMAALIELRGVRQMETATGRLLFAQALSLIISDCIRAGMRVPDSIPRLLDSLLKVRVVPCMYITRINCTDSRCSCKI